MKRGGGFKSAAKIVLFLVGWHSYECVIWSVVIAYRYHGDERDNEISLSTKVLSKLMEYL